MARGRMIDQGFTRSDKLNSVPRDARLAYASILPILDREGRTCAEPLVLKVNVFRKSDFTVEEIVTAVAALARVGLIRLYADADNAAVLEYARFLDFNSPNSRERASEYPAPDDPRAMPLRDPDLLAALAAHDPGTDKTDASSDAQENTPRAMHVQRTDDAPDEPVQGQRGVQGNVNGTGTGTYNGEREEEHSLSQLQPPPAEPVEAPPRRDASKQSRSTKNSKARDPSAIRAIDRPFVDAWNENRGPLPAIVAIGKTRERSLDELRAGLGANALSIFRDAVRQVAKEPVYREKNYNIGHLISGGDAKVLKWAEKWRNGGNTTPPQASPARDLPTAADFERVPTNAELLGLPGGDR